MEQGITTAHLKAPRGIGVFQVAVDGRDYNLTQAGVAEVVAKARQVSFCVFFFSINAECRWRYTVDYTVRRAAQIIAVHYTDLFQSYAYITVSLNPELSCCYCMCKTDKSAVHLIQLLIVKLSCLTSGDYSYVAQSEPIWQLESFLYAIVSHARGTTPWTWTPSTTFLRYLLNAMFNPTSRKQNSPERKSIIFSETIHTKPTHERLHIHVHYQSVADWRFCNNIERYEVLPQTSGVSLRGSLGTSAC